MVNFSLRTAANKLDVLPLSLRHKKWVPSEGLLTLTESSRWTLGRQWSASQVRLLRKTGFAIVGAMLLFMCFWSSARSFHARYFSAPSSGEIFWWESLPRLNGYYQGRKTIVPYSDYVSEQQAKGVSNTTSVEPKIEETVTFEPYYDENRKICYLDSGNTIKPPSISAYPGLPQNMAEPLMGSYEEVGLNSATCFDRVVRLGPYGWGYSEAEGGLGIGMDGDNEGIEKIEKIDFRGINWSEAQERCVGSQPEQDRPKKALIIRTWHDFEYSPHQVLMLRALISELSLGSGGEYTVHFLIHVHDESIPIWASEEVYNEILRASLPAEFQGMGTLWSVPQMRLLYPPPFPKSYINISGGDIYSAYRSLHFALQYFASKHEYDYYWHWEMDIRVTGHYYELLDRVTRWAEKQPREYLWERSSRFYIPALYNNSYSEFDESIRHAYTLSGRIPISGPQVPDLLPVPEMSPYKSSSSAEDNDEITDLITFNPLFDPTNTSWAFALDVTGWNTSYPAPPRRASLITATRLSRRLLTLMHMETFRNHRTMFPEMYPASVALHYGLKAVYVPVPLHFDRQWEPKLLEETFNPGPDGSSGLAKESVFGPREHVFNGAGWYSRGNFAGALWRRWLGRRENGEGGPEEELRGNGRMCLRNMLLHPVKFE